jgi:hypothetical protein
MGNPCCSSLVADRLYEIISLLRHTPIFASNGGGLIKTHGVFSLSYMYCPLLTLVINVDTSTGHYSAPEPEIVGAAGPTRRVPGQDMAHFATSCLPFHVHLQSG